MDKEFFLENVEVRLGQMFLTSYSSSMGTSDTIYGGH